MLFAKLFRLGRPADPTLPERRAPTPPLGPDEGAAQARERRGLRVKTRLKAGPSDQGSDPTDRSNF